jgi:hypothetical protein
VKKINKEQLPKRNLVHDKLAHGKKTIVQKQKNNLVHDKKKKKKKSERIANKINYDFLFLSFLVFFFF